MMKINEKSSKFTNQTFSDRAMHHTDRHDSAGIVGNETNARRNVTATFDAG